MLLVMVSQIMKLSQKELQLIFLHSQKILSEKMYVSYQIKFYQSLMITYYLLIELTNYISFYFINLNCININYY